MKIKDVIIPVKRGRPGRTKEISKGANEAQATPLGPALQESNSERVLEAHPMYHFSEISGDAASFNPQLTCQKSTGLPEGWRMLTVENVGADDEQPVLTGPFGTNLTRNDFTATGVPVITISCLTQHGIRLEKAQFVSRKKAEEMNRYKLKLGDLLFSRMASVGRAGIVTEALKGALFNYHIMRLRLNPRKISTEFFTYYVQGAKQVRDYLLAVNHGATRDGINTTQLLQMPVIVPPRDEQRRIVAEIEKQFTRLEVGVTALRRVQANLKRYRAAVLKAACEGRLVPAETHWKRVQLRELIGTISQGWSPKCDLTRDPLPDEWAIVTTTAVQSMRYIDNQGKPLPSAFKPRPHIEIQAGDFLMTRKGPRKRAGVACLVRSTRSRLMVCDTVYRFRCNESRVSPGYLELALNSPSVVEAIDRQKAGINESGVSLTHDKLGGVLIPLPPLSEQTRIVTEVERRLSVLEELEAVVSASLQRATRLRQSILQRAFSGGLVAFSAGES